MIDPTTPAPSAAPTPRAPTVGPRQRTGKPVALVAGLGIAAVGAGVLAIYTLTTRRPAAQGPVETPTREQFVARAGEAMRNSSWLEAEAVLREAISIYDRDQELRLQLADVLRTRATAAAWQRDTAQTTGSGEVDPDAQARLAEADAAARRQDSLDAYEQLRVALDIGPRSAEVEFRAGLLASECGNPEQAIEHFQAARAAAPDNAEYALYLAQAQRSGGQGAAAKATLLACVNLDPENAIAWGTLAEMFLQENKPELAIENARKARAIQPDVTVWRLVEARAHKRRGDAEEAVQLLVAIPESQRHETPVLTLLAECYAYLGRPADAAARYAEAADAQPANGSLAYETAVWFQRANNIERAKAYAERGAMLANPDAIRLRDELQGQ